MKHIVWIAVMIGCASCGGSSGSSGHAQPEQPSEVIPDAPPVSACADAPLLSFEQLAARERADEVVAVEGVPRVSVACTLLDCGSQECCNSCSGTYHLMSEEGQQVNLLGLAGCGGMDCDTTCEPFGRYPTKPYRFVGRHIVRVSDDGTMSASDIEVTDYCRAF